MISLSRGFIEWNNETFFGSRILLLEKRRQLDKIHLLIEDSHDLHAVTIAMPLIIMYTAHNLMASQTNNTSWLAQSLDN